MRRNWTATDPQCQRRERWPSHFLSLPVHPPLALLPRARKQKRPGRFQTTVAILGFNSLSNLTQSPLAPRESRVYSIPNQKCMCRSLCNRSIDGTVGGWIVVSSDGSSIPKDSGAGAGNERPTVPPRARAGHDRDRVGYARTRSARERGAFRLLQPARKVAKEERRAEEKEASRIGFCEEKERFVWQMKADAARGRRNVMARLDAAWAVRSWAPRFRFLLPGS
jgi:hypothetical protein